MTSRLPDRIGQLSALASAGSAGLPITNQPGGIGVGTALWFEQLGVGRRTNTLDRIHITRAGQNALREIREPAW